MGKLLADFKWAIFSLNDVSTESIWLGNNGETLVVRDGSNLSNCAGLASDLRRISVGFASDLRRICVGFVSDLCRICVGFAPDLCRIWRGILTLALTLTPTSSIPRQSDEVVWKPNICRATKLRV